MKQANNNEVDLLLRSLAMRRGESGSRGEIDLGDANGTFSDHLDADELNSYAEGVVPALARTRFVEHLADCEACRSIVIDLSRAAGAAGRFEVPQQQGGSSLWQKLMALFSPAVLGYAVPALLVTAVIGIGLLAVWQQRRTAFIAQNRAADAPSSTSQVTDNTSASNPSTKTTPSTPANGIVSSTRAESQTEKSNLQDKKTPVATIPLSGAESTMAKVPAKDSSPAGEGAGVATTQPYALEPKAAAPPPQPTDMLETDKSAELAKERPAKREDQGRAGEVFRSQDEEHGPSRSRNNTASPANQRNAGIFSARGPSGLDKNKASVVETRSVSGRRFTREDNVWIDADYDPSRATIKVARGSEQFRALVADEPGLRAIADQLSGAVIVVWKNRAYRIQ